MPVPREHSRKLRVADDLFPCHPRALAHDKSVDILQSEMISGFEAALDEGMQPIDALDFIICWVSREMFRIRMDRTGSSS
jgi:hypothetical protein